MWIPCHSRITMAGEVALLYKMWVAYALWIFGGFGCLGLHRFYLKKIPSGILWLFSGGCFFMGSLYDLVTLNRQVRDANLRDGYLKIVQGSPGEPVAVGNETLEKTILRGAQAHNGRLTPAQAALGGSWGLKEVQRELDRMAKDGFCELKVTKAGSVVYYFSEFDKDQDRSFDETI